MNLEYLWIQSPADKIVVGTDVELAFNDAILAIDAVGKLRDVDVAKRLAEEAEADCVKKGCLSRTNLTRCNLRPMHHKPTQPCKPIVNFPLPTPALSASLTYLLGALLTIFTP